MTEEDSELASLKAQVDRLTETVERLAWREFYSQEAAEAVAARTEAVGVPRLVRATSDGWLKVKMGGLEKSLPSGLEVSLERTAGGRDYGVVREGYLIGQAFDVVSGNLVEPTPRLDGLIVNVRSGQPVRIGDAEYDLRVDLAWRDAGQARTLGPIPALTMAGGTVPPGTYDLAIADFPHPDGLSYPPLGTAWFRIQHPGGAYYLHAGRRSDGCITCEPSRWPDVFQVVHRCRKGDGRNVGVLRKH